MSTPPEIESFEPYFGMACDEVPASSAPPTHAVYAAEGDAGWGPCTWR